MTNTKTIKKLAIVLTILVIILITIAYAVNTVSKEVHSTGIITTSPDINVYSDETGTNEISTIDWGTVAAGTTANQIIYVKNTGTGTMSLSMAVSDWSPSGADTYLTITWDQEGTQLSADQTVAATITLTASASTTGIESFTNTIAISGTG